MASRQSSPTVALVTSASMGDVPEHDKPLIPALERAGARVDVVAWDDREARWAEFDLIVLKSTWDYPERPVEFDTWVQRMARGRFPMVNAPEVVRWNYSKAVYLKDLDAAGVPIVPFAGVTDYQAATLAAACAQFPDSAHLIVKPAVGGSANRVEKIARPDLAGLKAAARSALQGRKRGPSSGADPMLSGALIQPFLREVVDEGELSLLYFGGRFSHAVLKTPKAGDFRVQYFHGGSERLVQPSPAALDVADRAIAQSPGTPPAYARVDLVTVDGEPLVMELELIEPCLFLDMKPGSERTLATVLLALIPEATGPVALSET